MSYKFETGKIYRMPTHFGPALGPRQGPNGRKFECKDFPKSTSYSVSFLTNPQQLEKLLPPGFFLDKEPLITVTASYIKEIEWLAGRGYNTLGISFPAVFQGEKDYASGNFLTVLWENLTDPILTGREELGFSKIFCDLPEPKIHNGEINCEASWMGFKFMDLIVKDMVKIESSEFSKSNNLSDDKSLTGILHYKYIPKTGGFPGSWGEKDIAYAVLTPSSSGNQVIQEIWKGEGEVNFHRARWEDLPTQYTIVNTFNQLEIIEITGSTITKTVGAKDISDQRILL